MAEKKDSNRVPEAELILPRGKKVILQAEDTDYIKDVCHRRRHCHSEKANQRMLRKNQKLCI